MTSPFLSPPPRVRLVQAFSNPVRNAVATARTCYSSRGIIEEDGLQDRMKYLNLARSVFGAGHHTVFQHAHFQFAIENVSRQFVWSFLHAHPFYNSEQVSQRYVEVREGSATIPALEGRALGVYRDCIARQFEDYARLREMLCEVVEEYCREQFSEWPRREKSGKGMIEKHAQEIARYVLPVAGHAYLYHTVSALTVMRYVRMARQLDAPTESAWVAERMWNELLRVDADFATLSVHPIEESALPEWNWFRQDDLFGLMARAERERTAMRFLEEFERDFRRLGPRRDGRAPHVARRMLPESREGDLFPDELAEALSRLGRGGAGQDEKEAAGAEIVASRLVGWEAGAEKMLARAVRQVLGISTRQLSDDDAIALVMDPKQNPLLGDTLNLTTLNKLTRALVHPHYTFLKCISHTADSQDQRHRMVPASRPYLTGHLTSRPDYVTPGLIELDPRALALYRESMERTWEAVTRLRRLGVEDQWAAYLLPNAVRVRFMETGDLLNLRHKLQQRLCYNAQEEIWRASVEEARQIAGVHPRIGRHLLPPCAQRHRAGRAPHCPEGPRYCGVRVWTLGLDDYHRVL